MSKNFLPVFNASVFTNVFAHIFSKRQKPIIIIITFCFILNEIRNFLSHIYKNRLFTPQLIEELELKTNRKARLLSPLETPEKFKFSDVFRGRERVHREHLCYSGKTYFLFTFFFLKHIFNDTKKMTVKNNILMQKQPSQDPSPR